MSRHGEVILSRMIEMIDRYTKQRTNLRQLIDDLGSMYQSLEPAEQPAEKDWKSAFVPLDQLISDRSGRDVAEMRPQIDRNLGELRRLLSRCMSPASASQGAQ